jgi:dUTP pyrophosphatase
MEIETQKLNHISLPKIAVRIKKWPHFKGPMPAYQSALASGFDIRAQLNEPVGLLPGQRIVIPTGLSFEIPRGYELQARPRSGLAMKNGVSLVNSPGTIDADFRGEVKIILINLGQESITVCDQDRIAQLVLCPVMQVDFVEALELNETERAGKGFGSTGVRN